jgi:5-methylcytosine-specific restriction endonuclease McrA
MNIITIQAARSQGLKRYFTGKPCCRGHITLRQTSNGTCFACSLARANAANAINPEPNRRRARAKRLRDIEGYKAKKRAHWASLPMEERRARRLVDAAKRRADPARTATHRANVKAGKAARRARDAGADGQTTASDVRRIYEQQRGRCADCRKSLRRGYHADHIVALAIGGSNWPRNIQLLCPPCNIRKAAKHPIAWARELGRLL